MLKQRGPNRQKSTVVALRLRQMEVVMILCAMSVVFVANIGMKASHIMQVVYIENPIYCVSLNPVGTFRLTVARTVHTMISRNGYISPINIEISTRLLQARKATSTSGYFTVATAPLTENHPTRTKACTKTTPSVQMTCGTGRRNSLIFEDKNLDRKIITTRIVFVSSPAYMHVGPIARIIRDVTHDAVVAAVVNGMQFVNVKNTPNKTKKQSSLPEAFTIGVSRYLT